MQQVCANPWCRHPFEIAPEDLSFLEKISPVFAGKKELIPPPSLCFDCRLQRKACWRNERSLHHRTCSLCERAIVAMYPANAAFPVFCSSCFFGDGWDPVSNGRDFTDSESFFVQFERLKNVAPRLALLSKNSENSDFTNHSANNRNCYLCSAAFSSENVFYSFGVFSSRDIVDCSFVFKNCELLYECFWVSNAYNSSYLIDCNTVDACHFCIDLVGCRNCFLCSNVRNKSYCIRNEQYTPDEYGRQIQEILSSQSKVNGAMEEFILRRRDQTIYRNLHLTQSDKCEGDYLSNCSNLFYCFDAGEAEDSRYCVSIGAQGKSRNCMDCFNFNTCELLYEVHGQINGYANIANSYSYDVRNCLYIDNCHNCSDCFGCIGIKQKKYCILNRQYTKEEYERLVPKIIGKMRADGEWGTFFPVTMSPFAYNEAVVPEYFPLTKEEVLERGWRWRDQTDEMPKVDRIIPATKLPDSIDDVPEDILSWAIECDATKRPFKIIKQELDFYRKMRLPIPRFHPDERHRRRMELRNPRQLWERQCVKCLQRMMTSYSPERPEIVYCETCYLKEVY